MYGLLVWDENKALVNSNGLERYYFGLVQINSLLIIVLKVLAAHQVLYLIVGKIYDSHLKTFLSFDQLTVSLKRAWTFKAS